MKNKMKKSEEEVTKEEDKMNIALPAIAAFVALVAVLLFYLL